VTEAVATSQVLMPSPRCGVPSMILASIFFLLNFDLKNRLGLFKNSSDLIEIEWKCCGRKKAAKDTGYQQINL
jgi:hypothetical protein